jgi:acetyl-CoA carboxylase biotin carboxyl carrier protein
MEIEEIRELLELIRSSGIEEFEMEKAGVRLRVRNAAPAPQTPAAVSPSGAPAAAALSVPSEIEAKEVVSEEEDLYVFKAPIVGTFYITSKPDAEPFVQPGDRITKNTVVCIIEAMKIFNQIESDVTGEIVEVLVANGQPVEFGEPLFRIRLNTRD